MHHLGAAFRDYRRGCAYGYRVIVPDPACRRQCEPWNHPHCWRVYWGLGFMPLVSPWYCEPAAMAVHCPRRDPDGAFITLLYFTIVWSKRLLVRSASGYDR